MHRLLLTISLSLFSCLVFGQFPAWDQSSYAGGDEANDVFGDLDLYDGNLAICGLLNSTNGDLFDDSYGHNKNGIIVQIRTEEGQNVRSHFIENRKNTTTNDKHLIGWLSDGSYVLAFGFDKDTLMLNGTEVLTKGHGDVAVVHYLANGSLDWVASFGGSMHDLLGGMTVYGNEIFVGINYGSPSVEVGKLTYSKTHGNDNVVVKLSKDGDVLSSFSIGEFQSSAYASASKTISGLENDDDGRVYALGTCSFNSTLIGGDTISGSTFVVSLNGDWTPAWSWQNGSGLTDNSTLSGFCVGESGEVYLTGFAYTSLISIGPPTHTGFVMCLNDQGNMVWEKEFVADDPDFSRIAGSVVSIGDDGKLYATVTYIGNLQIAGDELATPAVPYNDGPMSGVSHYKSIVLTQLNQATGAVEWYTPAGGDYDDNPVAMKINDNGDVYLGVTYQSEPLTAGDLDLPNTGTEGGYYFHFEYFHWRHSLMGLLRYRQKDVNVGLVENGVELLKIYPNPVTDVVNVEFDQTEEYQVDVNDQLGRTLISLENPTSISLEGLKAGWYNVRLTSEQGVVSTSVLKK